MPEQPPPTTRILNPHSGLPSSSRRSSIFLAAVSVNVIIHASLESRSVPRVQPATPVYQRSGGADRPSEDSSRGQNGQLLQRRVGGKPGHQEGRLRHLLRLEHQRAV